MNKRKQLSETIPNPLLNSVLVDFQNGNQDLFKKSEWSATPSRLLKRQKTKAEIAFEKFTESTLNEEEIVELKTINTRSSTVNTVTESTTVSTNILSRIQNINNKLTITEAIWANALKQLTALHELAASIKRSNTFEIKQSSSSPTLEDNRIVIVLPTLPLKSIEELIEFEKALSDSEEVVQNINTILEGGNDQPYTHNCKQFVKWNLSKVFKPELANELRTNPSRFQLKNSLLIKILIQRILLKLPMLSHELIVQSLLDVMKKFDSTDPKN